MEPASGVSSARGRERAGVRRGTIFALALVAASVLLAISASGALAAKTPPVGTSVSLSSSAPYAEYGHEGTVVFTATVTANNGQKPSGKGAVLNGTKKVCALTYSAGKGSCSPKPTGLKNGSYSLRAEFKKSSTYAASTSSGASFVVGSPPETTITSGPSGQAPSGPTEITFSSNEPFASYECSLDGDPYQRCSSPDTLSLGPGAHEFAVRAISSTGIPDPTPATLSWTSVGQAPRLELCGEIAHSQTLAPSSAAVYVITCNLVVRPKVTLTVAPGTILKAESGRYVDVEGALHAVGTAEAPITFTSWRDDTAGGDTNGDGNATLPAAGDWGYVYATTPGGGNPAPTITMDHVAYAYGATGPQVSQAATSITNSTVSHVSGDGIYVASPVGIPTVENNTVNYAAGNAISVDTASIDMGALNGNSGGNDGLNGVALANDTVTVSSSLPWTGSLLPVLTSGCSSLTVPAKVTLTLGPGTIVKGESSYCTYIYVEGALIANGTSERPVTFTSWRDDSVGGDTNDDGSATLPAAGDWGGIRVFPGGGGNANPTLSLDHVVYSYAGNGIETSQATTSVTDSLISHVTADGISVSAAEGTPTVANNTVNYAAGDAVSVSGSSIDMGALNGNSGGNDGLNGVALGNDTVGVSSSLPWTGSLLPVLTSGCNSLTIPAKVTLTLGPGTIIKGESNYCTEIADQGSLIANGTSERPVTFTSWRDDSVGGDTNDDGNATLPAAGDWGGIYTSSPGNGNASPTLSLDHVSYRYASGGISASGATTSITNSTVSHVNGDGISVSSAEGIPTVEGNAVTFAGGNAISIGSSSIDMGKLNGNSGSSDGLNGVSISADVLGASSALPWTGSLVPVLASGCDALRIPAKLTLTLGAGTIVKAESSYCTYLVDEGSLVATGTSSKPVTFTSWRDDSVGGDTNGDGNATLPAVNDWGGIYTSAPGNGNAKPTLSLDHVDYRYAAQGIRAQSTAATTVTNSAVEHVSGTGIYVEQDEGSPTVENDAVTYASGEAIAIADSSIDLGALTGDTGASDGLNGVALTGDKLAVSSSLPWGGNLLPVLAGGYGSLKVPLNVTLTMNAGTVVKGESNGYLTVEGSLVGNGTSGDPVVLTSWKDDTAGGDTNGDGNATSPAAGDWGGVTLENGGTASLESTVIRYAQTGLNAQQKSYASYRGRFEHNDRNANTCGWGGECAIDAPYTYWGSSEGPYAGGNDELACGAITATPYLTSPSGGATNGPSPYSVSCGGGPSVESRYSEAQASAGKWLGQEHIDCGEGFQEACEIIERYEKCLGAATQLAQSQNPFTFSNGAQDVASDGASWLQKSESTVVRDIGHVASFGLQLVGLANTFIELSSAYSSCT